MTQEGQIPPPPVMWAQTRNTVFVTICLEDCKEPILKIEPEMIYFKGTGGTDQKMHEVTINLYEKIEPNKTIQHLLARNMELILYKQEFGPHWPRLIKEKTKVHWLRNDFNKWKDEDTDEDVTVDMEELMQQIGELEQNRNKPDLKDMSGFKYDGEVTDSDDEDLPDLE
ncbi:hypothetical protein KM043_001527 [Ampulex compressa]|nr:hypothetical protein KM043_001527 [Ampulex compressa]